MGLSDRAPTDRHCLQPMLTNNLIELGQPSLHDPAQQCQKGGKFFEFRESGAARTAESSIAPTG
jgi:hypothetical protein